MNKIMKALQARVTPRNENEKGFTLIELLVVVLIIGILSAIAIPIFLGQQAAARDSASQADVTNAKVALLAAITADPADMPAAGPIIAGTVTGFTPSGDVTLTLFGDIGQFCISGVNPANADPVTYASADSSGTVEGDCTADGGLTPAV